MIHSSRFSPFTHSPHSRTHELTHSLKQWASIYKNVVAMVAVHKPQGRLPHMKNGSGVPEAMRLLHPDCKKLGGDYAKKHGDAEEVACKIEKWSPARDLMTWKRNTHGKLQPAVYDATGKRIAGGCPGMNPWRE